MAVLVAGGTGALGGAVVHELLDSGYAVTTSWIVDRERERIESELGDRVSMVQADLLSAEGAEAAVEAVDEDFDRMIELNLAPNSLVARAAMPRLVERGGGAFVAVSARPALRPFAGAAGYITGKAAVLAFVQALDSEYRDDGVRCNAILPSVIDTAANRSAMPDADQSKWVPPAEIARVVRFLVSGESAPVSGAGIPVYGRA